MLTNAIFLGKLPTLPLKHFHLGEQGAGRHTMVVVPVKRQASATRYSLFQLCLLIFFLYNFIE